MINTILLVVILGAGIAGVVYWLHTAKGAAELALLHEKFNGLHARLDQEFAAIRTRVDQIIHRNTVNDAAPKQPVTVVQAPPAPPVVTAPPITGAPANPPTQADYDAQRASGTPNPSDPKRPADADTSDAAYAYWTTGWGPSNGAPSWVRDRWTKEHGG